ncbi:Rrf2 family transcriptional regulator [Terribacillus halophilus]|jgi:Rrf2 family protein|uniref:Rrf2 family transcriptional regulator n=1 Tax=Terribacillus halophilus TaxID=361279 RepID=UPI00098508C7|nr:Rrf2 family transcriptional regulator [Terribacillus halophilus]
MKYSKATNYALHSIAFLGLLPPGKSVGVKPLAELQKVSPTYLSKVLTTLVKAGLISSATGVKGGYKLMKHVRDISFWDVIQAVEGQNPLFQCGLESHAHENDNCFIQRVMNDAERKMEEHLQSQTIEQVLEKIDRRASEYLQSEAG